MSMPPVAGMAAAGRSFDVVLRDPRTYGVTFNARF